MEEKPSGSAVARWSSLPNDILDNIRSRLDLSPNTSISISATTFDIKLEDDLYETDLVWNILDNLFTIFANLPVLNTFRLQLPNALYLKPSCWHIIGSWARRLCQPNLQHFKVTSYRSCLTFGGGCRVDVPNIFRMNSLVSLDLNLCINSFLWRILNSIDLPNLNKLSLILVDYTNLQRPINSCPSLRELYVTIHKPQIANKGPISISSKELKRLSIYLYGSSILEVIIDTPKLEHLYFYSDCVSCDDEIILDSITHVKSLTLVQPSPLLYNYPSPTNIIFPNMTRLILALGPFRRLEDLSSMLHCPILEELELEVTDFYWINSTRKPKVAPFEHVKQLKFQMDEIRLDGELLELVEYLLRSMSVLEKLILYARSSYSSSTRPLPEDQFYRSLIECPRCSPVCEIEFSGAYGSPICSKDLKV